MDFKLISREELIEQIDKIEGVKIEMKDAAFLEEMEIVYSVEKYMLPYPFKKSVSSCCDPDINPRLLLEHRLYLSQCYMTPWFLPIGPDCSPEMEITFH